MKTYPLEIENIGEDVYCLISRGHHDIHVFMKAVREAGFKWQLCTPEHLWFQIVPSHDPAIKYRYVEVSGRKRGAFPVTCTQESDLKGSYEQQGGRNAK